MNNSQPATPNFPPAHTTGKLIKRLAVLLILCMLLSAIPFAIAGPFLEAWLLETIQRFPTSRWILTGTALMLAVDIFLPVPSSAVITFCGSHCGIFPTTIAASIGLTLGGSLGYELSRWLGNRILTHFSNPEDVDRLQAWVARYGGLFTVVSRPLPILGETAILIAGCLKLNRIVFYTALCSANLIVSAIYASFGYWWRDEQSLPIVLALSLFAPLLLTFMVRKSLKQSSHSQADAEDFRKL